MFYFKKNFIIMILENILKMIACEDCGSEEYVILTNEGYLCVHCRHNKINWNGGENEE